ncbi:MAG: DUF1427 family protein [Candidatus Sungbacteria bacterium]|nr:DUF1427 family protein [Candidatus Sungbacteria bacterium]
MLLLIKSLATGFITGLVFAFFRLPIPAPGVLAGVVGIVGIYLGYVLISWWRL